MTPRTGRRGRTEPFGHRTIPHQERIRRDERQRYEKKEEIEKHRISNARSVCAARCSSGTEMLCTAGKTMAIASIPRCPSQKSKEGGEFVTERVEQGICARPVPHLHREGRHVVRAEENILSGFTDG